MPGGFTWADAFQGFAEGVLLGIDVGAWIVAPIVAVFCVVAFSMALASTASRNEGNARSHVRAMARERQAKGEALLFTDEPVDFDWPERKAS